jgi:hypothetical protein
VDRISPSSGTNEGRPDFHVCGDARRRYDEPLSRSFAPSKTNLSNISEIWEEEEHGEQRGDNIIQMNYSYTVSLSQLAK